MKWCCALLVIASMPVAAQSPRPPRPDFKNLRFDEVWPLALRPYRWDDAIKNIPLAGRRPLALTLGGQLRWREEFARGFNVSALDDDYGQSRLLLSADLVAGRRASLYARGFGEFRDAQSYGRTLPGGARPSDADRHDMQNLFAEVGYGRSFARVGRQEIALGRERLVGVPDWANTRRGSQGARAQLVHGRVAVEVIDMRPILVRQSSRNVLDSTARLRTLSVGNAAGAKALSRGLPAVWQLYRYDQTVVNGTNDVHRVTSGARTMWQWGTTPAQARSVSLEFEGALQTGHANARAIDAWFWVVEAQWQLKRLHGAPAVALGLEQASGERASTADAEMFNVLYPAAHAHGGFADVIGRPNARELHLIGTWDPVKPIALRLAIYRFDRLRLDDGIYTKQNTIFRAAHASRDRHAADEIDLTSTWKVSTHWRVIAGAALVEPGPFLRGTAGGARTEHWGFAGTAFTF